MITRISYQAKKQAKQGMKSLDGTDGEELNTLSVQLRVRLVDLDC